MMRKIRSARPLEEFELEVEFEDGAVRVFDVKPHLNCEAFLPLKEASYFRQVRNGTYFVYWPGDLDLGADTLFLEGRVLAQTAH